MPKYLYLLYADESQAPAPGTPEMDQQVAAYDQYFKEVSARGLIKGGDPVQPSATATTVRVRNGSTNAARGPFASGGDQLVGFYLMEAKDESEAVTYAARVPAASYGAVEVRPVLQFD